MYTLAVSPSEMATEVKCTQITFITPNIQRRGTLELVKINLINFKSLFQNISKFKYTYLLNY